MFHEYILKLNALGRVINDWVAKFVGLIVLIMFFSLITQVCCRYFLHSALSWPEEFTMYLMSWMSFLGGAVALYRWGHIGVDFFLTKLSGKWYRLLMLAIRLVVLAFVYVLMNTGIDLVASSTGMVTDGMRIPMVYPRLSMPLGCGLMVFNCIILILSDIDMLINSDKYEEANHG